MNLHAHINCGDLTKAAIHLLSLQVNKFVQSVLYSFTLFCPKVWVVQFYHVWLCQENELYLALGRIFR